MYGLDRLAVLATLFSDNFALSGESVAFYIDNNTLESIVKNAACPLVIHAMNALLRHAAQPPNITARGERVHAKRDVACLPTRRVMNPFRTFASVEFDKLSNVYSDINRALGEINRGAPVSRPKFEQP